MAANPQIPAAELAPRFTASRAALADRRFDFIVVGAGSAGARGAWEGQNFAIEQVG